MDWQLPDIGKMVANNILPSILSTHTVSIWRFRRCIDRLKLVVSVNFRNVGSCSPRYAMICT